jgi:hypothetical protein
VKPKLLLCKCHLLSRFVSYITSYVSCIRETNKNVLSAADFCRLYPYIRVPLQRLEKMAGGGGGSRGGKRKRPSGKTAFRPKGKKPAKDKEMFKRRKYARNNYVLENKVRPAQFQ